MLGPKSLSASTSAAASDPTFFESRLTVAQASCYVQQTDSVLRRHYPSLESLYSAYSGQRKYGKSGTTDLSDSRLLSIGEWLDLLTHCGLFEMSLLTAQKAKRIFLRSRIRSVPDYSDNSEASRSREPRLNAHLSAHLNAHLRATLERHT